MVGGGDWEILHGFRRDIPKEKFFPLRLLLHEEHLVEIAIENLALPADVDCVPTHESLDGGGVEIVDQELVVVVPLAVLPEVGGEARDGETWGQCANLDSLVHG